MSRPVHVEFGIDPSAHQVFQMSASGPIWAIFHRPGTHRYVVRIHDGKAQWRLDFVAAENSMGFHAPGNETEPAPPRGGESG